MVRSILCTGFMLIASVALVMADQEGTYVSNDGKKITISVKAKGEKKGTDKTFELADNVKVTKKDGKNFVEITGGLKAEELKAGAGVKLIEDGTKVKEIQVKVKKAK